MSVYLTKLTHNVLALILILSFASVTSGAILSPSIDNILDNPACSDSLISVIVFAEGGTDAAAAKAAVRGESSLQRRHEIVITGLKSANMRIVENIKNEILCVVPTAQINEYWIAPALVLEIPVSAVEIIAAIPGVAAVVENAEVEFIEPVESSPVTGKIGQVYNHITDLNIPALWHMGLTGRGRLVCNFDTGVEGTHPALSDKWRGNSVPSSTAFFAPSSVDTLPFDKTGHGTHTMGLMVGSADADSFGVAPAAEWISAAVVDQGLTLSRTLADIVAAFQWAADPDGNPATVSDMPDVILNSWGVPTTVLEACDATFDQVIDNVEAAGIVTIFAAGNEGPDPQSLRLPANRASSPLNAFAIGAVDQATNIVTSFSSRGPSSCDTTQIKPEVVAPGLNLYSCTKGGGYTIKSGTSMAAPLIAGMVALLRQYNPDATVEQIKTAIIQSSRDLGVPGEDNDYGHGLPDAYAALSYLPAPAVPEVYIADKIIGGDAIAEPGEAFDLYIRLEIPGGSTDTLTAFIGSDAVGVDILDNEALFFFDNKSIYSVNISPFIIKFDSSLLNGEEIEFKLFMQLPFQPDFDTLSLSLTVGYDPKGVLYTHTTPSLEFTVSDFGQYGFGFNSIYPAGGSGLTFRGSENLLYEAGIIVGRNSIQLSSSVRDNTAKAFNTDFAPREQLSTVFPGQDGGRNSFARYDDIDSDIPLPITINQTISSYDEAGDDGYVIFNFDLVNQANENLNGVYFGYLCDFDITKEGDMTAILDDYNLIYQSDGNIFAGVMPLERFNGSVSIENIDGKTAMTDSEKYNYISFNGNDAVRESAGDYLTLISFGPFSLTPGDSTRVSLAIVLGESEYELEAYAVSAREKFTVMTAVEDDPAVLPTGYTLNQNYPNPFNPETIISFDIERAAEVELEVYNALGQKIKTLFDGHAAAGSYKVTWDGTDNDGQKAGSGIYFYRLKSATTSVSRKMLLLK